MMDCWNGLGAWRQADPSTRPEEGSEKCLSHTFFAFPCVLVLLAQAPWKKLGSQCHTTVLQAGLPAQWLSLVLDKGTQIWGQQRGKGRVAWNVPGITGKYGIIPQRKGRVVDVSSTCGHEVSSWVPGTAPSL